jgi:hypothetical protein
VDVHVASELIFGAGAAADANMLLKYASAIGILENSFSGGEIAGDCTGIAAGRSSDSQMRYSAMLQVPHASSRCKLPCCHCYLFVFSTPDPEPDQPSNYHPSGFINLPQSGYLNYAPVLVMKGS